MPLTHRAVLVLETNGVRELELPAPWTSRLGPLLSVFRLCIFFIYSSFLLYIKLTVQCKLLSQFKGIYLFFFFWGHLSYILSLDFFSARFSSVLKPRVTMWLCIWTLLFLTVSNCSSVQASKPTRRHNARSWQFNKHVFWWDCAADDVYLHEIRSWLTLLLIPVLNELRMSNSSPRHLGLTHLSKAVIGPSFL